MTKSADERHARRYRHSADRERGRGRAVHRDATVPPLPSGALQRSPSPAPSSKHRKLDDAKDRRRQASYMTQYKKYQQQSSPRTEQLRTEIPCRTDPHRTSLPIRPCIKYQPVTVETALSPTALPLCHQLLAEVEPELMDEQPLTDVDALPSLSDHEPYFDDSLEEYESSRDDVVQPTLSPFDDETAAQDQPTTEIKFSSVDEGSPTEEPNIVPDLLSPTELEPTADSVLTEGLREPIPEVVPVGDTAGSIAVELPVTSEVLSETLPEVDEDSSVVSVEQHSPDVAVTVTSGQSEDCEVTSTSRSCSCS